MYEFTTPENQLQIWLPSNDDTKTINYGMRFLISNNKLHPIAWHVSKYEDVLPEGVAKVTFAQSQFDPHRDSAELMLADYYGSNITPEEKDKPYDTFYKNRSEITFNGTQRVLKINGSYKTFIPHFYNKDNEELDIEPIWSIEYPSEEDVEKFDIIYDGRNMKIKCLNYYDLVGKIVTIYLDSTVGSVPSTLEMEVVSL